MKKSKFAKYFWWLVLVVIGIWIVAKFVNAPEYPDIFTPKPVLGNAEASVTITEFSDLQCPACRSAHPVTKQIVQEYGDLISFEYKHFPLTSIHPNAFKAAEGAECANDQGKFWEFVDLAFSNQQALQPRYLKQYASKLDIDEESFSNCLDSRAKRDIVSADQREGINLGVQGTPTFYINGVKLENWNYQNFKSAIDAQLG